MQTPGPNIYQWLVQVPKGNPSAIQHADSSARALGMDAGLTTGNPRALEEPREKNIQSRPHVQHSDSNDGDAHGRKRLRISRTSGTKPQMTPRNQYERRPRHKTRSDKYDYKTPATREKSHAQSGEGKSKRLKTRKHSMNEDFHASNVPPGRLTVRSSAKTGIFNKGRASSPIKTRGEPGFSEVTFLSRKNQIHPPHHILSEKLMSTPSRKDGHRLDYPRFDIRNSMELEKEDIPPGIGSTSVKDQARASIEKDMTSPGHEIGQNVPKSPDKIPQTQNAVNSPVKSRSATPYTWSVTDDGNSQQVRALDAQLLSLLRVGLFSRQGSEEQNLGGSTSDYCDIEDLRRRLQDRKAHWELETNATCSHSRMTKDPDASQKSPKSSQLSIQPSPVCLAKSRTEFSESKDIPKASTDGVCVNTSINSHCKMSISGAHEPPSVSTHQHAQSNVNERRDVYPVSDEAFFNMLDKAFDAIVNSDAGRLNSSQETPQSPQLSQYHAPSQPTEPSLLDLENIAPSFRGSVDPNVHERHRTGKPRPLGPTHRNYAFRCPNSGLNPEMGDVAFGALNREILPQSPGRARASLSRKPFLSPAAKNHAIPSTIPANFWRRNRLY